MNLQMKLFIFAGLLSLSRSLDCNECSHYILGSFQCDTSGQNKVACEHDARPQTQYREINNPQDIISLAHYIGDLNMLNDKYYGFFEYANKSAYIIQELFPDTEDQLVDLTIQFASLQNLDYNQTANGNILFIAAIYTFDASDFNETKSLKFFNYDISFEKISNFTFKMTTLAGEKTVLGASILVSCSAKDCKIDIRYLEDTFTAKSLFQQVTENIRSLDLAEALNEESSIYGRFFLLAENTNTSIYSLEDFETDAVVSGTLISLNFLQQTYFMTLEMIGTIELEELQSEDVYYQSDRIILTLNSKIEELQKIINNMPAVGSIQIAEEISGTAFHANEIDVFCRTDPTFEIKPCTDDGETEYVCVAKNKTQIKIPQRAQDYFDVEMHLTDTLSLLFRSTSYLRSGPIGALVAYYQGGYIMDGSWADGSLVTTFELFLVPKNALEVPYNIDPDFVLNLTYTRFTQNCGRDSNDEAILIEPSSENISMLFGNAAPATITTTENVFYGLQLFQLTSEEYKHELGHSCATFYSKSVWVDTFNCSVAKPYTFEHTNRPPINLWFGDSTWGYDVWGAIFLAQGLPVEDSFTVVSNTNGVIASYAAQGDSDKSINFYQAENNDVINYLYALSNAIDIIQEEISEIEDVLEELTKPEEMSFWDWFNTIMSVVDMADFAINFGKTLYSLTRNTIRFFKAKISKELSVAEDFGRALKSAQSSKGSYNPVEAVNNGAVYNYFGGKSVKKFDFPNTKVESYMTDVNSLWTTTEQGLQLTTDTRLLMMHNSAAYAGMSKTVFSALQDEMRDRFRFNFEKTPFGEVSIHKSPIDILAPIGGKFVSDAFPTSLTQGFLSNKATKYPFHTSFSSVTFEMNAAKEPIICKRYGGIAEASTVGPTNVKNPKVKVGIVKLDYKIVSKDDKLSLEFLNWDKTEKLAGKFYTETDVDLLYKSFVSNKVYKRTASSLTADQKWRIIELKCSKKYYTRDVIDSVAVANPLYMKSLDRLFDYNTKYNGFNYNLWNRNCQSFVKAYASLASKGVSSIKIADANFEDFVHGFYADYDWYFNDLFPTHLTTRFQLETTLRNIIFVNHLISRAIYN